MENINKPVKEELMFLGITLLLFTYLRYQKKKMLFMIMEGGSGGSTLELHIVPRGKENILTSLNFCCFLLGFQAKEEACKQTVCVCV